jgi:PAS domain-containing protein
MARKRVHTGGKDEFLGNPARPNGFLRFERSEITPMTVETRGTPPPSQPLDLPTVIDAIPALVVSALPDGSVKFVNQGRREYAGRSLDELTGSGWQAVIPPTFPSS